MILYYFLKTEPSKEMTLSLYNDIPKIYEDFENFMNDFNNDDIKKVMIVGGCRAYLDAFSDYMNPLLIEMDKAEKMFSKLK